MIPYLSTSELGLIASGLYCILTAVANLHPSIPQGVDRGFLAATVFLLLISKNPVITYSLDATEAKEAAFAFAIVVGVLGITAAWWRGHFDCEDHSPVDGDSDDTKREHER